MPNLQILEGQDAIVALQEYINELTENADEGDLTQSQIQALVKSAEGLISAIKSDLTSRHPRKNQPFLTRFKSVLTEKFLSNHGNLEYIRDPIPQHNVLLLQHLRYKYM
jgi:hypothetical protein